jgi:hypothetical protein
MTIKESVKVAIPPIELIIAKRTVKSYERNRKMKENT